MELEEIKKRKRKLQRKKFRLNKDGKSAEREVPKYLQALIDKIEKE